MLICELPADSKLDIVASALCERAYREGYRHGYSGSWPTQFTWEQYRSMKASELASECAREFERAWDEFTGSREDHALIHDLMRVVIRVFKHGANTGWFCFAAEVEDES